mgnify:CR=1 FL=1
MGLHQLKQLTAKSTDAQVYQAYGIRPHQKQFNAIAHLRTKASIAHAILEWTPKQKGQYLTVDVYIVFPQNATKKRWTNALCRSIVRDPTFLHVLNHAAESKCPLRLHFTPKSILRITRLTPTQMRTSDVAGVGYKLRCRCKIAPHNTTTSPTLRASDIVAHFGAARVTTDLQVATPYELMVGAAQLVVM